MGVLGVVLGGAGPLEGAGAGPDQLDSVAGSSGSTLLVEMAGAGPLVVDRAAGEDISMGAVPVAADASLFDGVAEGPPATGPPAAALSFFSDSRSFRLIGI
jgi:hypothetical protein